MRSDQQLVVFRDDPARLAGLFRTQADTALHDPYWTPEQQRRRHDHYMTEAARIEREAREMRDEQRI